MPARPVKPLSGSPRAKASAFASFTAVAVSAQFAGVTLHLEEVVDHVLRVHRGVLRELRVTRVVCPGVRCTLKGRRAAKDAPGCPARAPGWTAAESQAGSTGLMMSTKWRGKWCGRGTSALGARAR